MKPGFLQPGFFRFRKPQLKAIKYFNLSVESTPKSRKARHYEARSNLIILKVNILRLLHFARNDAKLLFGVASVLLR